MVSFIYSGKKVSREEVWQGQGVDFPSYDREIVFRCYGQGQDWPKARAVSRIKVLLTVA